FGLLELASSCGASSPFPAIRAARLPRLARVFAGRLAHLLACICWLALSCHSVSDHRLLFDANTGEPRADAREKSLNESARWARNMFFSSERVANQNASIKVLRFDSVMRFSHRFLTASIALIATLASLRSAAGAQAFVIVDSQTGYLLEEQEPRKKLQIGSLTKIATASVVLDWAER